MRVNPVTKFSGGGVKVKRGLRLLAVSCVILGLLGGSAMAATTFINIGTGSGNNTRTAVFPRSYEYVRAYWPDETAEGTPAFYADYNYTNWLFAPTPDAAYPFEVLYYELPPLLSSVNQTNWLTEYAPQLLLYGTLLEATPFLKNDERIGVWQQFYDRALNALNTEDLKKMADRASFRTEA